MSLNDKNSFLMDSMDVYNNENDFKAAVDVYFKKSKFTRIIDNGMSKSYKRLVRKYAKNGYTIPTLKTVLIGNSFVLPETLYDKRFKSEEKLKKNIQKKINIKKESVENKKIKSSKNIARIFNRNRVTPKFIDSERRIKYGKEFSEFLVKPVRVQRVLWNNSLDYDENFDIKLTPLLMNYPNGSVQIDVIYKHGQYVYDEVIGNYIVWDTHESKRSIHVIKLEDRSTRTRIIKTNAQNIKREGYEFHRQKNIQNIRTEWNSLDYGQLTSSSEKKFLYIDIKFLTPAAGGCSSSFNGTKISIGKNENRIKINCPHSTNNNCLFKCISKQYPDKLIKFGLVQCNEIRQQFGIEKNAMISIENAIEIFKFLHHDKEIAIYCQEYNKGVLTNSFVGGSYESEFKLLLIDSHYSIIEGQWSRCTECFKEHLGKHKCNAGGAKYVKERKNPSLLLPAEIPKNVKLKDKSILSYDIETQKKNEIKEHRPYIVGFHYYDENEVSRYKSIGGRRCMKKFYDLLGTKKFQHIKYLNAFNGSRFDHYYLMKEKLNSLGKDSMGEYIINNSRILKLTIQNKKCIDLGQHLLGSLKKNLEDSGCEVLKGDIDHDLSVEWEETTDKRKAEVEKYLMKDVMGLSELYEKNNAIMFEKFQINLCDSMTTSSNAYHIWKNRLNDFEVNLPSRDNEDNIRKAIYGGRTQLNKRNYISKFFDNIEDTKTLKKIDEHGNNVYKISENAYNEIDDYLFDADVVSLYSTAMLKEYPVGKEINTVEYQEGKLGIYRIEYITNKSLLTPILPRKENGGLKWDLIDSNGWYSSIDIENAKNAGYQIKIFEGIYWEKSAQIFKKYVEEFYQMKSNSEKGTCSYATAKLYLNALYGKMLQGSIRTKEKIVSKSEEFAVLLQKNKILQITELGTDRWIVSYETEQHNKEEFAQKPSHMGVFILGYSRRIMIEKYNQCGNTIKRMPYYFDTDSMVIPSECLDKVEINPSLGGIMDDVGGKILKAIFIAPKLYAFKYISSKTHTLEYHFRGKGVSTKMPSFLKTLQNRGNTDLDDPQQKLWKDFEDMYSGKSKTFYQNFSIKKIGLTKSSNEKCPILSHRHIDSEQTKREINKNRWGGRVYVNEKYELDENGDYSIPHGFDLGSIN